MSVSFLRLVVVVLYREHLSLVYWRQAEPHLSVCLLLTPSVCLLMLLPVSMPACLSVCASVGDPPDGTGDGSWATTGSQSEHR